MLASSSNSFAQAVVRQFGRSLQLMYIRKSRGPIMHDT